MGGGSGVDGGQTPAGVEPSRSRGLGRHPRDSSLPLCIVRGGSCARNVGPLVKGEGTNLCFSLSIKMLKSFDGLRFPPFPSKVIGDKPSVLNRSFCDEG